MKIDSTFKLILAIGALFVGFCLPDIWEFIKALFGD